MDITIKINLGNCTREILACVILDQNVYSVQECLASVKSKSVYLTSSDDVNFPYLVSEAGQDSTSLYGLFKQTNFNTDDALMGQIVTTLNNKFDFDTLKKMEKAFKELTSYLEGNMVKIGLKVDRYLNLARTKELVEQVNKTGSEFAIEGENKTLGMEKPEDEFFIRVPSYNELIYYGSQLPDPDSIYNPYGENEGLKTLSYKQFVDENYPMEYVLGNPKNNELPLQSNEQRYYNSIVALLKEGIKKEFPEKDVDTCLENNVGSSQVFEYITKIGLLGLFQNWLHIGLVPINLNREICDLSDDDEDDGSDDYDREQDDDEDGGKREFYDDAPSRIPNFCDGAEALITVLSRLYSRDVFQAIEFVIKLNRFGNRKPTRLKLWDNEYLELSRLSMVQGSGDFSNYEVLVDEKGDFLFPTNVVTLDDYISDNLYIRNQPVKYSSLQLPIGFVCEKRFKDTTETATVVVSFIDLVESKSNLGISGLVYNESDGEFEMSNAILEVISRYNTSVRTIVSTVSNSEDKEHYTSDKFKDTFLEKECFSRDLGILYIINKYLSSKSLHELSAFSYNTTEELDALVQSYLLPHRTIIESSLASEYIALVTEVNDKYMDLIMVGNEFTTIDVLNLFKIKMGKSNPVVDVKEEPKKENLDKLNNFTNPSPTVSEPKTQQVPVAKQTSDSSDRYIQTNIEGYKINAVVVSRKSFEGAEFDENICTGTIKLANKNTGQEEDYLVVGYLANTGVKTDTQVLLDYKNQMNYTKIIKLANLSTVLSNTIKRDIKGNSLRYKFDSVESCTYYCNLINQFIKYSFKNID